MTQQSNQLAVAPTNTPKASALALLASRLNVEPEKMLNTLKSTVCNKATNEEIMAFCIVANEYGLNPFLKELYAFPAKSGGIIPVVSIDGWIRIVNEHPMMDGIEFSFATTDSGSLISCTCTIHRKDRARPIVVTEFLSECKRATDPWKMESRMLRHKALIQCARVAFGFSGITDEDEAEVIGMRKANGREVPDRTQIPEGNAFSGYAEPETDTEEPSDAEQTQIQEDASWD